MALAAGCVGAPTADGFATEVVDAPHATGSGFGDAERAVNGVRGGGEHAGSTDVYSVGLDDDHLVLGWEGAAVFDGPGDDLVVFENPFVIHGGGVFIDPTEVALSPDGDAWVSFPCAANTDDPQDPAGFVGCAGLTPVHLHADTLPLDPFDPDAGGDRFDLADLPDDPVADWILAEGARYVRLRAAAGVPRDPVANGPDIDGVAAR